MEHDTLNNLLTQQLSDYFRNSVIRDNQNRLIVLYRNENHLNRTNFHCNSYPYFFTEVKAYAKEYGDIDNTLEVYINSINPFGIVDGPKYNLITNAFLNYCIENNIKPLGLNELQIGNYIPFLLADTLYNYLRLYTTYDCLIIQEHNSDRYTQQFGLNSKWSYIPFNSALVKRIDNKNPTESDSIIESRKRKRRKNNSLGYFSGIALYGDPVRSIDAFNRFNDISGNHFYDVDGGSAILDGGTSEVSSDTGSSAAGESAGEGGGALSEAVNALKTWHYDGPLYYNDNKIATDEVFDISAESLPKAINLAKAKFAKEFGGRKTSYDFSLYNFTAVAEEHKTAPQAIKLPSVTKPKLCPNCNIRLTDGGYCPICDLGESDYF